MCGEKTFAVLAQPWLVWHHEIVLLVPCAHPCVRPLLEELGGDAVDVRVHAQGVRRRRGMGPLWLSGSQLQGDEKGQHRVILEHANASPASLAPGGPGASRAARSPQSLRAQKMMPNVTGTD